MPPKTRPRAFPEAKVAFRVDEALVWHTPHNRPDRPDPADWCHQVPPRPSLPHAPGVRMTAVITNSLKLYGRICLIMAHKPIRKSVGSPVGRRIHQNAISDRPGLGKILPDIFENLFF